MATVAAVDFIESVLEDEGWQEELGQETITAAIQGLEGLFPAGTVVEEQLADRVRVALRTLKPSVSIANAQAQVHRAFVAAGAVS